MTARGDEANSKRHGATRDSRHTEAADLEQRVLEYFQNNARAMDSAAGVARFWIGEQPQLVESCLMKLHGDGLLDKRTIAGTDFFSLHQDTTQASASGEQPMPAPRPDSAGHLLVVDDDPDVRQMLATALKSVGHDVVTVESADRAIDIMRAATIDVVVTDLRMPGRSGLHLLRAVKQSSPATEVIVVTGHADLDTAVETLRNGAYDLLTKPLSDLEILFRAVERAVQKRRLTLENELLVETLQERNRELKETVARLAAVNEISKATTGMLDLREIYDAVVRMVAQHLKVRRVSVMVGEPDSETLKVEAAVGITDPAALDRQVRIGQGIAGRVAATQSPLLVTDIGKSEFREMTSGQRYSTPSFISAPLTLSYPMRYGRKRVGVINASDKYSGDSFSNQDLEFLSTVSAQIAVAIEHARLVKDMDDGYVAVLAAMVQAVEDASPKTRGHSRRVARLATSIAESIGLSPTRIRVLQRAAALHQLGRLTRSDSSSAEGLLVHGENSAASYIAAGRILAPIASLRDARELLLHAADWFDYTSSIVGIDHVTIPVESRILAVCDEFARNTAGQERDRETGRRALDEIRIREGLGRKPDLMTPLGELVESGEVR
jgi:response regulator RpfG family c-di-GMP phosphodiesterase